MCYGVALTVKRWSPQSLYDRFRFTSCPESEEKLCDSLWQSEFAWSNCLTSCCMLLSTDSSRRVFACEARCGPDLWRHWQLLLLRCFWVCGRKGMSWSVLWQIPALAHQSTFIKGTAHEFDAAFKKGNLRRNLLIWPRVTDLAPHDSRSYKMIHARFRIF